ncbi:hypothetical protein ACGFYV_26035 [Streptomyces sp. NPDC048297]|uniref:hypothetical protein n=1 Tax=Streptomyces sp. NPDC048297 TaxID=3365531 RepID=UPI003723C4E2
MKRPSFRRRSHTPSPLSLEDQAVVDQHRATLAAVRNPQPWTPGGSQDIAVRVGPFVERAHTRPGDDHGPDMIAVALVHPDTPHAGAYGCQLGYNGRGWLRCQTTTILGTWQPGYAMLTHAAAGLPLPDDVGMDPAHYALYIEARRRDDSRDGYTLLRLGPYTQTRHAQQELRPAHRRAGRAGDHPRARTPHLRAVRAVRRERPPAVRRPVRGRRRGTPGRRRRGGERVTAPALHETEASEGDDGTMHPVERPWTPGEDAVENGFLDHSSLHATSLNGPTDDHL